MTTPTNWPNPERPGVPPNSDVSGWYWIKIGHLERPLYWDSGKTSWFTTNQSGSPRWICSQNWKFLGPVLTPTQLTELLAGERERCVEALQEVAEEYRKNAEEVGTVMATNSAEEKIEAVDDCWVKIRNLGDAP